MLPLLHRSRLFFPAAAPAGRLLALFAIFAAGFVTRPLGPLVFGHIADRFGRSAALNASMALMALPTVAIGCLPTYGQAGAAAPLLLLALRLLQGLAAGEKFASTPWS